MSDYVDTIKLSTSRTKSKSRSRNSSEEKFKEDKKSSDLKLLVQKILAEMSRIYKETPGFKEKFSKLNNLL